MQCAAHQILHVCLHIDWNPYGTFKGLAVSIGLKMQSDMKENTLGSSILCSRE